jgi:hypothetical protein
MVESGGVELKHFFASHWKKIGLRKAGYPLVGEPKKVFFIRTAQPDTAITHNIQGRREIHFSWVQKLYRITLEFLFYHTNEK